MDSEDLQDVINLALSLDNFGSAFRTRGFKASNLTSENIALKERLADKEKQVSELTAKVEALSKSLEEAIALKEECFINKEKELQSILLEKQELKARLEVLSSALLTESKHDHDKRMDINKNVVEDANRILNSLETKSTSTTPHKEDVNKLSLSFENLAPAPSHDTGTKQTSFNQTVPYSRNPLFPLKSNTSPFSDKYHTGTKQIPLFSSKSNMPPFADKYPGNANQILSLELSSTSEMHHAGTKQKPLCNQEDGSAHMSSKLTGPYSRNPLFPLKSNTPPVSDTKSNNANQILSLERESRASSTSEMHHSGTKEKCSFNQENGSAHTSFKQTDPYSRNPLFPLKSNTPPFFDKKSDNANQRKSTSSTPEMHHAEPVSSRSLESKSSSEAIYIQAHLAHTRYPYNNFPTPGPVSFCEECKEVHETYYYCIKKPCSACYSKDHHIGTCPYFRFIPQGVDFNRDVYEVVCACHSPFYQDQWYCSSCPGTSIGTRLKAKYCLICKSIGHHSCYECPEDKVRADVFRSDRNAHFISTKLSLHERIPKPVDLNKDARKRLQYLI